MAQKRFSKDPKVKLISIKEFLEKTDYLFEAKKQLLKENTRPSFGLYYKITSRFFISIHYTFTSINFGLNISEKLDRIEVAYRDGKTEYELFDLRMRNLLEEKEKHKRSKRIDAAIEKTKIGINFLKRIKYSEQLSIEPKAFEDYLTDVEYKTQLEKFKGKYVVFDVETNGTRRSNDDLLSISIYDPTNGKCYNRYLPLDLQPLVLTGWIHGITDKKLEAEVHITQDELNKVIDFFDLKNKILLSFSGGQGTFDSTFIINYCKRHNLVGFENLHYENIKSMFPVGSFGLEGQMSKDNLCRILKIDGVQKVHSSMNDCILEWKLFEKIKTESLFFIDQDMYKYNEGYIVPVSYLNKYPKLATFANITVPYIVGKAKILFEFSLPRNILKLIKKFPTNITGIALENAINSVLNVEKQDNLEFLVRNKSHLEYIGSLDSQITEIPVVPQKDGTMKSLDHQYDEYVGEVNKVTKIVTDSLTPVFAFIKQEIFTTDKIMSQELSISTDGKVLALCDLSNEESVLEIKTLRVSEDDGTIIDSLAKQLYYESKGRKTYALSIYFDEHTNRKGECIVDAVNVRIYQIALEESEPKPIEGVYTLDSDKIKILEMIQNNPLITNAEIARNVGRPPNSIGKLIKLLVRLKYIVKEDKAKRGSKWILLRSLNDIKTKYSIFNGEITWIFDENHTNKSISQ